MGQSTDAILFYGYCWEDELDEDMFPEELQNIYGKEHAVLVGAHCHHEYPMPYVYIQESQTRAWRGSPQAIDPTDMVDVVAAWDGLLQDFVTAHGIDVGDQVPRWWLVSYWG